MAIVKRHQVLPGGGHEFCPLIAARSARWRPSDVPGSPHPRYGSAGLKARDDGGPAERLNSPGAAARTFPASPTAAIWSSRTSTGPGGPGARLLRDYDSILDDQADRITAGLT